MYISFFPFKKSEQPQIVAFNRIVVNYNIHFFILFGVDNCLLLLLLTIVRQDTKIGNGTTNDFSESCLWIFVAFMEERGKENNTYFIDVLKIENVEVRLIENG